MRSTLSLCGGGGGGGGERGLRARVGRMKRLLCLRPVHRVDVQTDMEPGVWLRSFQLLDPEGHSEDPVQEWGEEVEEGAVFGITLRREPTSLDAQTDSASPGDVHPSVFSFAQYHTVKVRRLKAATLERLVCHLLDAEHQEGDYARVFLSTYRTFTCPNTLIELLFQRDDVMANLDNSVCPRSTLLPVIRLWLEEFGEDFREPPQYHALRLVIVHLRHRLCFRRLALSAETLLKRLQAEDHSTCQATLKETGDCQQPEEEGRGETDTKEEEPQDWMDVPEKEVAEQLTRFDAELFARVVPFQCLGCVWSQRDKKENRRLAPTVRATIAQFNAVTNRVITSLLCPSPPAPPSAAPSSSSSSSSHFPPSPSPGSPRRPHTSPAHRAQVIERWIGVAQECRQLKNFSSLKAILSALQSNAVYRLKKTWAAVSRESMATFNLLCETFPDENCVLTNREILLEDGSQATEDTTSKTPKICPCPSKCQMSNSVVESIHPSLVHFEKRRREFEILSQIRQLQASCSQYSLPQREHISSWLQAHSLLSDQESYELSRYLEPPVDPCPSSPCSWSHRLLNKKLTSLLSVNDSSSRKTHADQISVSSSGSSSSEMEDLSSTPQPSPLRLKLQSLSGSLHDVAEDDFSSSSSSSSSSSTSSSPTPSTSSFSSSQADLSSSTFSSSMALSPEPSTSSSSQPSLPVYNRQVADSCIVRVSVEFSNDCNVYKSILLTSQDHTPQVIQRALEKHNLQGVSCHDFSLSQLLSSDKELQIPDKANVFYAMCTQANYDFVLRQRWRSHSRHPFTSSPSSSPGALARARHGK
ncbi:ral guanine nucleotide dissociation stimulator-like 1 [Osmerus eperlanus]|uniref:ral guanine nucleotide dissociation stimulator-like 1 n=1 Tax=Osmerus eperlanus TaxID=29151 RepID=UPI002E0E4243